ncbi:MAG: diguanylate cyclase [Epsilonproteobacteria bacterium]|nr:diguanylate cyclase [Campylobacterota bacterium]
MTIKDIAKKALNEFKSSGYIFTPKEYEEKFCKIAKQYNVIVEDCNKVAKYIAKLDAKYKAIANNYNIKNLDELIVFLINYLNREDVTKEKENIEEIFRYAKRALDVIAILPIITSQKIAIKHLDFLKPYMEKEEWNKLREEWLEFLDRFDDTVVKKGARIAGIRSNDALEVIDALIEKMQEGEDYTKLVDSIVFALTPSYAPQMSDEIAMLKKQVKENPDIIVTPAFAEDLKTLTEKRIKLDKAELKKKLKDIDQIAERLSIKILRILQKTDGSSQEIKEIKEELQNWRHEEDFESVKDKLLKIAISLDKELGEFSKEMKKENDEIEMLKAKIRSLEDKVKKLSTEARTDFLTNVPNKKALEEELEKQEAAYQRYKTNYSVAFFDIDFFKKINDTYGHEAGDVILKSFALLIKRYIRDVDLVGRYGGEEFVVVLPNTDLKGAYKFAEKLRSIVEKTKFLYKKTRINVTVSGGVAERNEVNSKEEVLKLADDRLYIAKKTGRNKICDNRCDKVES